MYQTSKGGKVIEIGVPQCYLFYLPRYTSHFPPAPSCPVICPRRHDAPVSPITPLPPPASHTATELAESKSEHILLCLKSHRDRRIE